MKSAAFRPRFHFISIRRNIGFGILSYWVKAFTSKTKGGEEMEDSQIVELYWRRDEAAIGETERKYGALCRGVARNILGTDEDAEECVNDALHQAWNAIPPQRPDRLGAWLGRVTRNLALNLWSKNRARKRYAGMTALLDELADCVPAPVSVERELEGQELSAAIDRWLRSLPRGDRVLFLRRYWYGVELRELAAERGVSPNRLAQKMFRLRQSLKNALEKEGFAL